LAFDFPRRGRIPLEFMMGSFYFQIHKLGGCRLGFRIDNDTTMASGTHLRGRNDPSYLGSVEELVEINNHYATRPLSEVINVNFNGQPVVSILKNQTRSETIDPAGGGNLYQTYAWTEQYSSRLGGMLPNRVLLSSLDIGRWENYPKYTDNPW
jgi:hypothetical protein